MLNDILDAWNESLPYCKVKRGEKYDSTQRYFNANDIKVYIKFLEGANDDDIYRTLHLISYYYYTVQQNKTAPKERGDKNLVSITKKIDDLLEALDCEALEGEMKHLRDLKEIINLEGMQGELARGGVIWTPPKMNKDVIKRHLDNLIRTYNIKNTSLPLKDLITNL